MDARMMDGWQNTGIRAFVCFSLINYRKYSCLNMYLDTELFPLLSPGNKSAGCINDATQCF